LVISGDFVEVLWFQGFTEYLPPGLWIFINPIKLE